MSFTITTDVFCDECNYWTSGCSEGRPNRAGAWQIAKSRGWLKRGGRHLCPVCNGRAKERTPGGHYLWVTEELKEKYE